MALSPFPASVPLSGCSVGTALGICDVPGSVLGTQDPDPLCCHRAHYHAERSGLWAHGRPHWMFLHQWGTLCRQLRGQSWQRGRKWPSSLSTCPDWLLSSRRHSGRTPRNAGNGAEGLGRWLDPFPWDWVVTAPSLNPSGLLHGWGPYIPLFPGRQPSRNLSAPQALLSCLSCLTICPDQLCTLCTQGCSPAQPFG